MGTDFLVEAFRMQTLVQNYTPLVSSEGAEFKCVNLTNGPGFAVADPGYNTNEFTISFWLYLTRGSLQAIEKRKSSKKSQSQKKIKKGKKSKPKKDSLSNSSSSTS